MILHLFKAIAAALIAIFCIALGYQLITAKSAKEKYDPDNPPIIKIADKRFQLPVGFSNFKYGITHGGYEQLEFTLDVDTFKTVDPDYSKDSRTINIELRPTSPPEFGEKNYWTKNDPIYQLEKKKCVSKQHHKKVYDVCDFEGKKRISSYGYINKRALYDLSKNEYISMFGCTDKSVNLNQICVARSRILDNLQAEYSYMADHYEHVIEIDFAIRDMIESMHQPATQEKNP